MSLLLPLLFLEKLRLQKTSIPGSSENKPVSKILKSFPPLEARAYNSERHIQKARLGGGGPSGGQGSPKLKGWFTGLGNLFHSRQRRRTALPLSQSCLANAERQWMGLATVKLQAPKQRSPEITLQCFQRRGRKKKKNLELSSQESPCSRKCTLANESSGSPGPAHHRLLFPRPEGSSGSSETVGVENWLRIMTKITHQRKQLKFTKIHRSTIRLTTSFMFFFDVKTEGTQPPVLKNRGIGHNDFAGPQGYPKRCWRKTECLRNIL
nr:uncharacterized protein LOC105871356 isoform X2 [Microcebus murinus]